MSLSSKILEKTTQIQQLLDELNQLVVMDDFQTPTSTPSPPQMPVTSSDLPPVEYTAPTKSELEASGVDVELLDFLEYGNKLKPKKFLGDFWKDINDNIVKIGGEWIRDGKNSRFEVPMAELEDAQ